MTGNKGKGHDRCSNPSVPKQPLLRNRAFVQIIFSQHFIIFCIFYVYKNVWLGYDKRLIRSTRTQFYSEKINQIFHFSSGPFPPKTGTRRKQESWNQDIHLGSRQSRYRSDLGDLEDGDALVCMWPVLSHWQDTVINHQASKYLTGSKWSIQAEKLPP